MDVGVVMADSRSFHYSPLKLAEYLAAGLPVVAPDVAPLAELLDRDGNAVLYAAGDVAGLRRALGGSRSRRAAPAAAACRRAREPHRGGRGTNKCVACVPRLRHCAVSDDSPRSAPHYARHSSIGLPAHWS